MKMLRYAPSVLAAFAASALASVTVNYPVNGAQVGSPFALSATAGTCSAQDTAAMGYSLDNSSDTTIVKGATVQAEVVSGSGTHTLHIKAWGEKGSACVADVAITVEEAVATSVIPPNAVSVSNLQTMGNWIAQHDTGAGGSSIGTTSLVNSPSRSGSAREFVSDYLAYGNQRFDVSFGDDATSTNFFYDAWVYLPAPSSDLANLELDMNQTMANGQTAIFGFQCDGWSGTWDYTANAGTPAVWKDVWVHSKAACNLRTWSTDVWHHVQVSYSRDDTGNVTYSTVWLDGAIQPINATVPSAFALGWAPTLLTNLQLDGRTPTSGVVSAYLDDLTIYRW